jgi:hypothetical protein
MSNSFPCGFVKHGYNHQENRAFDEGFSIVSVFYHLQYCLKIVSVK